MFAYLEIRAEERAKTPTTRVIDQARQSDLELQRAEQEAWANRT